MNLPNILLDPLEESVTFGTFIDTKFYAFSRRDSSGHVGSLRPLYCNGHVLNSVPYFSTRKRQNPPRRCATNNTDLKSSQTDFPKDKHGISTMDSPLIPSLTPNLTITFPIATSKTTSPRSRTMTTIQTRKFRPRPLRTRNRDHKPQAMLKATKRQFRIYYTVQPFGLTYATGPSTASKGWGKLPSSATLLQ